jgi:hypothetical protein
MLRASKYNICVHVPHSRIVFVINGISGSIDAVDTDIALLLAREDGAAGNPSLTGLSDQALSYLASRGYLTRLDDDAETRSALDLALSLEHQEACLAPIFYLMTTYSCQLRCTYCFEHETRSRFRREGSADRAITRQLVCAAFAAMDQIRPDASALDRLSVKLFSAALTAPYGPNWA